MITIIQELMILNKAGIALFYHNFSSKSTFDIQLIAGYFDLIRRYTKKKMKANLKSFTLANHVIFFYSHESGLHTVFICKREGFVFKYEKFETIADILIENFLDKYKEELKEFNGNISQFRFFSQEVEEIIDITILDPKEIQTIEF